jgi:SPP1 family predicted phage head-tail adaptor
MIVIGQLRHRITFQEPVLAPDGSGGFTETWQDIAEAAEVSAAIVGLSGAEQLRFQQLQPTATHKIFLRYRDDITPQMRIVKDGRVYNILSVTDRDGTQSCLEILAESGAG